MEAKVHGQGSHQSENTLAGQLQEEKHKVSVAR